MSRSQPIAIALVLASCIGVLAAHAFAQSPSAHHHDFGGAERWARVFDDPARDAWQKPHEVIRELALAPNAIVADIGAGTGYFAMRLAEMLPAGRVYAVDVEPDMVEYLAERAKRDKRDNIVALAGAPDDPGLPEKVDLILMVDVYHHVDDRARYFRDLIASLKPGGRVAVIDFRPDSPVGPPKPVRMAADRVIGEMSSAGYRLAKEHRFLPNQYFLIFEPAS